MAAGSKRMTIVVTPDMEPIIDKAKQMFYNCTQSEMIRTLIVDGLDTLDAKEESGYPTINR